MFIEHTTLQHLGLDELALSIVDSRLPPFIDFLKSCTQHNSAWLNWPTPGEELQFRELFRLLESSMSRSMLLSNFLLPLATQLGMEQFAEDLALERCYKLGCFDRSHGRGRLRRPSSEAVLPKVREIIHTYATKQQRVSAFLEADVCRDKRVAEDVAIMFQPQHVAEQVAAMARGLIMACLEYGVLGLLHGTQYPCYDELVLLQRHRPYIAQLTTDTEQRLAVLRADVIALYHGLRSVDPKWWQLHLLHGPEQGKERQHYQRCLTPEVQQALAEGVQEARGCDEAMAEVLYTTLIHHGLPGLIDLRCNATFSPTRRTLEAVRVQTALEQQLGGLTLDARQKITKRLDYLLLAARETELSLSVLRLIREHPSSLYRRRVRSRFSARKKRPRRRDIVRHQRRRPRSFLGEPANTFSPENQCIARFAELSRINRSRARKRLVDFITYGPAGLLGWKERIEAIDQRLGAYLYLLKLGHLEGNTEWTAVLDRIHDYASLLKQSAPSVQVARGIFNSLPKPRRFNGGEGEAVASVSQRASLTLKTKQLLKLWTLVAVNLPIPVLSETGKQVPECYALIVLDNDSELPVGCWVSEHPPGGPEVGLAIYDAIWHPAWPRWPIRGIPKAIQVPDIVATEIEHVKRAAYFLLTRLEIAAKESTHRDHKLRIVKDLMKDGVEYMLNQVHPTRRTCEQVYLALHHWLRNRYFPNHDVAPVPSSSEAVNVALPGYDSPAAGWLLPVAKGKATTSRNGVVCRGFHYTNSMFESLPGAELNYREFPYFYPDKATGIFIEWDRDDQRRVEYVLRTNKIVDLPI